MKTWAAGASIILLCGVPGWAQPPDATQDDAVSVDFLELEQEVDKTLLREAMLTLGRAGMTPPPDRTNSEASRNHEDVLKVFIAEKRRAVIERSEALKRNKARARPVAAPPGRPVSSGDDRDSPGLIGKLEAAKVDVQLLQAQVQLYQQPLQESMNALAAAEFAASNDKAQEDKADAARKRFEKVKARYVELSRRLRLEERKVGELQGRVNPGGMGGGFR